MEGGGHVWLEDGHAAVRKLAEYLEVQLDLYASICECGPASAVLLVSDLVPRALCQSCALHLPASSP